MKIPTPEEMLAATSRTFYAPTMHLPPELREAVMSSYLCLRAIDEIEDHPTLSAERRSELLWSVSRLVQGPFGATDFSNLLGDAADQLPQVTVRLYEWLTLCSPEIAPRIWDVTSTMAVRMADWVITGRKIEDRRDLDQYCFAVAGAVGLLLAELWEWYDGVRNDRGGAVAFGRALQSVNILRDQHADAAQARSYTPAGWSRQDLLEYAVGYMIDADRYVSSMPHGPARSFNATTLSFSWACVEEAVGGPPLTRELVGILTEDGLANGTVADHAHLVRVVRDARAMSGPAVVH
jgi:farnesyl-diphosphate farnesyltransferase